MSNYEKNLEVFIYNLQMESGGVPDPRTGEVKKNRSDYRQEIQDVKNSRGKSAAAAGIKAAFGYQPDLKKNPPVQKAAPKPTPKPAPKPAPAKTQVKNANNPNSALNLRNDYLKDLF